MTQKKPLPTSFEFSRGRTPQKKTHTHTSNQTHKHTHHTKKKATAHTKKKAQPKTQKKKQSRAQQKHTTNTTQQGKQTQNPKTPKPQNPKTPKPQNPIRLNLNMEIKDQSDNFVCGDLSAIKFTYNPSEKIGKGCFGTVYEAILEEPSDEFVVKVINC